MKGFLVEYGLVILLEFQPLKRSRAGGGGWGCHVCMGAWRDPSLMAVCG